MRILLVTRTLGRGDGQGRVNYEIVREALRRGHKVLGVCAHVDDDLLSETNFQWVRVPIAGVPTLLLSLLIFSAIATWRVLRLRDSSDLVIQNGFVAWTRSHVNVSHFVHSSWLRSPFAPWRTSLGVRTAYQWTYTALNARLERLAYQRSDLVIAVSRLTAGQLLATGLKTPVEVVHNGVDIDEFKVMAHAPQEGRATALFVGDLRSRRKNLDTVLRALQRIPYARLTVVGDTKRSSYPIMAKELGVDSRVDFVGKSKEVARMCRESDLFVFPSRYDPCPLVVLEAMASGLPVVTSRHVGTGELLDETSGVILKDEEDDVELAAVMDTFFKDGLRRRDFGRHAREIAEKHSFRQMAARYLDRLEKIKSNIQT